MRFPTNFISCLVVLLATTMVKEAAATPIAAGDECESDDQCESGVCIGYLPAYSRVGICCNLNGQSRDGVERCYSSSWVNDDPLRKGVIQKCSSAPVFYLQQSNPERCTAPPPPPPVPGNPGTVFTKDDGSPYLVKDVITTQSHVIKAAGYDPGVPTACNMNRKHAYRYGLAADICEFCNSHGGSKESFAAAISTFGCKFDANGEYILNVSPCRTCVGCGDVFQAPPDPGILWGGDGGTSSSSKEAYCNPPPPTSAPTPAPTPAPTQAPTPAPTPPPTAAPTSTPTAAPTSTPTSVPTAANAVADDSVGKAGVVSANVEVKTLQISIDADVDLSKLNAADFKKFADAGKAMAKDAGVPEDQIAEVKFFQEVLNADGTSKTPKELKEIEAPTGRRARRALFGPITFEIVFKDTATVDLAVLAEAVNVAIGANTVEFSVELSSGSLKGKVNKAEIVVVEVKAENKDDGIITLVSGSSTTAFATGLIAMLAAVATIV